MPDPPRLVTAEDFYDIPTLPEEPSPFHANGDAPAPGWQRLDLSDALYATKPDPPAICGLFYARKRHVLSGPPESTKTLIAYALLLEALRAGHKVAIVDFEMGATAARQMLTDLGATTDELQAIYYVEPEHDPTPRDLANIVEHGAEYVLIDAAATAYEASDLDDNARQDVEKFARQWIRPLWQEGIATLLVDHVTKNAGTRGKFAIGSERKVGQAEVHLSFDALKALSRGHDGLVKVTVHKDRPGFLQRPTATIVELHSDPADHSITWRMRDPSPTDADGGFRPTGYMERVSVWLEKHPDGASRNEVELGVGGGKDYVRRALDVLTAERFITETAGPRNARNVNLVKPYIEAEDPQKPTSADFGSTSARRGQHDFGTSAPPLQGAERAERGQTDTTSAEVDEEAQELIDKYVTPDDDGIPF